MYLRECTHGVKPRIIMFYFNLFFSLASSLGLGSDLFCPGWSVYYLIWVKGTCERIDSFLSAGFNSTLRQGNVTHHEYIQVILHHQDIDSVYLCMFTSPLLLYFHWHFFPGTYPTFCILWICFFNQGFGKCSESPIVAWNFEVQRTNVLNMDRGVWQWYTPNKYWIYFPGWKGTRCWFEPDSSVWSEGGQWQWGAIS